jgi:gamma-glutamylcyclotransferase (GGCT)/AIG2-like uncharacterized protein YtfP
MDSPPSRKQSEGMKEKFQQAAEPAIVLQTTRDATYRSQPGWFFFYGSLKDPKFLAEVVEIDEELEVIEAEAEGKCLKYFGSYPVLCSGLDTVAGVIWHVPNAEVVQRLRDYESNAYCERPAAVRLKDGQILNANAFFWNGDEEDLLDEPLVRI